MRPSESMKTVLKTAPAAEPVSLAEMKIHLHADADVTAEDTLLSSLIIAARRHVEDFTSRALVTQTWYAYLDDFPRDNVIALPWGSLQSVTSLKYKDSAGTEETMTATTQYLVDTDSDPGQIVLPYLVSWPSFTPYPFNAVTVEYVCGYGAAATVPDTLKAAIKLIVSDLYENRESQTYSNQTFSESQTVFNLMCPYRLRNLFK